ncbi:hypothetical protein BCEN4_660056 [Burkholderia cenocepacia]|nr:hypothetical protein BCEN4_660056 [Burkholderia cenocepacia]
MQRLSPEIDIIPSAGNEVGHSGANASSASSPLLSECALSRIDRVSLIERSCRTRPRGRA